MRVYQIFLFISTLLTGGVLLGIFIALFIVAMQDIYHEAILQTAIDGFIMQGGYASSLVVLVFGILFTLQLKGLRASFSE